MSSIPSAPLTSLNLACRPYPVRCKVCHSHLLLLSTCTAPLPHGRPEDALTSVSSKFIDEFKMACPPPVKDALKLVMGHVHVFVTAACKEYFEKFRRNVYVTPKSYLSFLQVTHSICHPKMIRKSLRPSEAPLFDRFAPS